MTMKRAKSSKSIFLSEFRKANVGNSIFVYDIAGNYYTNVFVGGCAYCLDLQEKTASVFLGDGTAGRCFSLNDSEYRFVLRTMRNERLKDARVFNSYIKQTKKNHE